MRKVAVSGLSNLVNCDALSSLWLEAQEENMLVCGDDELHCG